MIRVLIADDEKRIRDGLATTIPWAQLGMEVVGTASNGEAALAMAREFKPQIILTDVRMPRLDGLEFLKQLQAFLPRVKVVILSGYDDFSYARRAMQLGVSDYLVKPIGAEEIVKTLEALTASLGEESKVETGLESPLGIRRDLARLNRAVREGDDASAYRALGEWRSAAGSRDVETSRRQAIDLVDGLLQDLRRDGFEFGEGSSPAPAEVFSAIVTLENLESIDAWLEARIGALTAFVVRNFHNNHTLVVRRALEITDAEFNTELTVERVAGMVGLSPNYFSHLFKKVRGQGFKDHLNTVRIQNAQKLLAAGGSKVYEVAKQVGFSDYKYFSAVFKKLTGNSPTRYR